MAKGTEKNVKMEMLDRQLRSMDLASSMDIDLSPKLSKLAFVYDIENPTQAGLWATSAKGRASGPLVTFQDVARRAECDAETTVIARPRWSTDEHWLAFVSYEGLPPGREHRLWVVDPTGDSSPELLYESDGVVAAHTWSPDSDCLAVADSGAGLVIVRLDGTSEVADAEGMRYPLMENAMAWLDGGRYLLYMSLAADKAGLWKLEVASGQTRKVIPLSHDELAIPAAVHNSEQIAWGALRGDTEHTGGVMLHLWAHDGEELDAIAVPNAAFNLASRLLPNKDGSLWTFTTWKEGQRVPFVIDHSVLKGRALAAPGIVTDLLGWSDAPSKLWVLLHPPRLVGLDIDESAGTTSVEKLFSIELTSPELVYLLEALGAKSMRGLADPFADMTADETLKVREKAEDALVSKDYVTVLPDSEVQIDLTVAAMVQCCTSPQQSWTATYEATSGERDVRHFHRTQALVVEDAVLESGLHRLTPLRDKAALIQRVKDQVHLQAYPGSQPVAESEALTLPEEALFRIRDIATAAGAEAAARYLVGAGAAEATAAPFAQALARPLSNSSISCWAAAEEGTTVEVGEGLGILEGVSGLWLFQPCIIDGEEHIEVSPADAEMIFQQIAGLLTWAEE